MANRLAGETSPYLLQHKDNPVDWYPWGEEALRRAREEDKPILLSIGYSACHWCHVMEHESFEDPEIAAIMNENFINIKVDREERPDLDSIYMEAVQAMTGQGGWPMTVFLTPDGKPFYGGTYFPPTERMGMPSFRRVLQAVSDTYRNQREKVEESAADLQKHLSAASNMQLRGNEMTPVVLDAAREKLLSTFDAEWGGFGDPPKFPQPMILEFLLRSHRHGAGEQSLHAATLTLDRMAAGGMYDQIGGGFHRYSVDRRWLVPHFEKMLYDNAQLARLYLYAWQLTLQDRYRTIAEETLDYVRREMLSPEGGFYSSEDADSEGQEGKFYVWTLDELRAALGDEDARLVSTYYGASEGGNFEGTNILHVARSLPETAEQLGISVEEAGQRLAAARSRLREVRDKRVHPGKDTKILTSWNGLMLQTFAEAALILDRADYLEIAENNARFIRRELWRGEELLHSYKDGQAKIPGFLEDYSFYMAGLISLFSVTFDPSWLQLATSLGDTIISDFWDTDLTAFYETDSRHEDLFNRPRSIYDNAIPSGAAAACEAFFKLSSFTGSTVYQDVASRALDSMSGPLADYPSAFGRWLCAADMYVYTPTEIVIVGNREEPGVQQILKLVRERYIPNLVLVVGEDTTYDQKVELLVNRVRLGGQVTAYLCHDYLCEGPVTTDSDLGRQMDAIGLTAPDHSTTL